MLIAVIGDIHANARALVAALKRTERAGFDLRVLLGDVLTYGVDVAQTVDLVAEAASHPGTVLLRGNHDQAYDRLLAGEEPAIGGWVRRHLDWTAERVPAAQWRSLPFVDAHVAEGIFFAHANPFGQGDWTYLNDEAEHRRAAGRLERGAWRAGVFGHTHRPRLYDARAAAFLPIPTSGRPLGAGTRVANAGSIGQPRGSGPREVVLRIEVAPAATTWSFDPLDYDVAAHCRAISGSSLPPEVRDRCLGYFPGPGTQPGTRPRARLGARLGARPGSSS